jgi:hypothetical protein
MKSWPRWHNDPSMGRISCLAVWDDTRYLASVLEPAGERRVPTNVACFSDGAAMERADELLLNAYPHDCDTQRCESWQRLGAG